MRIAPPAPATNLLLPLQSHPAFAAALLKAGRDTQAVAVVDQGDPVAQLVLIRRKFAGLRAGLAARGPIWSHGVSVSQRATALRLLRKTGLTLVESDQPDGDALYLAGFRQVMTAAHVAELDLSRTHANRLKAMHPDWRNKWCKATRAGLDLQILPFPGDPDHWLLQAEATQRRQRRYHALPTDLTAAYAIANPGQAVLFQADKAGEPVAAMLILLHGNAATYQTGWSGPLGRKTAAHQLLLIRAAEWLGARGYRLLDLGTLDTEANPGLAAFKIGSGAKVRALGGSWLAMPWL